MHAHPLPPIILQLAVYGRSFQTKINNPGACQQHGCLPSLYGTLQKALMLFLSGHLITLLYSSFLTLTHGNLKRCKTHVGKHAATYEISAAKQLTSDLPLGEKDKESW